MAAKCTSHSLESSGDLTQLSLPRGAGKQHQQPASCISAESRRFHVIPRVSAALKKSITPIATAQTPQSSVKDRQDFQRYRSPPKKEDPNPDQNKQQEERENPAKLQVVKTSTASLGSESEPESVPQKDESPPEARVGIASAFFQVIGLLQLKKGNLIRWFGSQTYQTGIRKQKKGGTIKKGTMLDHKVE